MKQPPRTPELKALLAHLKNQVSPKQALQKRAAQVAADIIMRIQRQSRLKE